MVVERVGYEGGSIRGEVGCANKGDRDVVRYRTPGYLIT